LGQFPVVCAWAGPGLSKASHESRSTKAEHATSTETASNANIRPLPYSSLESNGVHCTHAGGYLAI
jgi:hypothetical protein